MWASGSHVCTGHEGSFTAKLAKKSQNNTDSGINTAPAVSSELLVESSTMSKVPSSGVTNTATMATSMNALPSRVKIRNFIAEYSLRPLPHIEMSMNIGTSSSSQNRKNSSRSRVANTPITAVCSNSSQMKYSLTRWFTRQDPSTAQNPIIPVSATNGALRPSTPMK